MKRALKIVCAFICLFMSGITGCYSIDFFWYLGLPELTVYHHGTVWGIAAIALAGCAFILFNDRKKG